MQKKQISLREAIQDADRKIAKEFADKLSSMNERVAIFVERDFRYRLKMSASKEGVSMKELLNILLANWECKNGRKNLHI